MASSKVCLTIAVFLIVFVCGGLAGGKRDYKEECSVVGQLGNIFRSDENDDPNACDTSKGLICSASFSQGANLKCDCPPTMVYEKSGFLSVFKGGKCVTGANFPCTGKDAECVSNSACRVGLSTCRCAEGYHARDGYCTNAAPRLVMDTLFILGLAFSYMFFVH